jgi:hypothetical protein
MTSENQLEGEPEEHTNETGEGYIYIIENEAFETPVVKIGKAKNLSQRINNLNTGVPLPFTCYKASLVEDMNKAERLLHETFNPAKKHWRGEFYEVDAWRVAQVLKLLEVRDATAQAPHPSKEEESSIDKTVRNIERKQNLTFDMIGIEIGADLLFAENQDIVVQVTDRKNKVLHLGEEYSISPLAQHLKELPYNVQGAKYWMYEGETLLERRERLEAEEQEGDSVE